MPPLTPFRAKTGRLNAFEAGQIDGGTVPASTALFAAVTTIAIMGFPADRVLLWARRRLLAGQAVAEEAAHGRRLGREAGVGAPPLFADGGARPVGGPRPLRAGEPFASSPAW